MSGDNINCPIDLLDDDSHDDGVPSASDNNIETPGFRDSHCITSTAVPDGYAHNMRMMSQNNNHETTTRQSYYGEATTQPHHQQTTSIHNTHMSYREGGDGSPAERKTSFGIRSEDYSTQLTEEIPSVANNNHNHSMKLPTFERTETDRFNAEHQPTGTVTYVGHNQDVPYYRQEENYNVNTYSKEYVIPTPTAIPRHNTSYNNDLDRHHTYHHASEEYTSRISPNYNNNSNKESNETILKDEIDRLNQELLNLHREHKKDVIQFSNENKKLLEENYQLKNKINELQQLCAKEKTFCNVRNEKNQQIILENLQLKRKHNQLNQDQGDETTPPSFQFHSTSEQWQSRFQELARFKEKNGNFKAPQGTSLYSFIQNQKTHYNYFKENKPSSMSHEKIAALESIGFEWTSRRVRGTFTWEEKFQELVKFKQNNGHLKVPSGTSLSYWIQNQKSDFKKFQMDKPSTMTSEKIFKLESIGIEWRK